MMQNRVKELRGGINLSQADVAARLGLSRQAVNAIETGRADPSLDVALRLARLFGQPVEAIFEPDALGGTAYDYQDLLATAIDEVSILDEMGQAGWELTGFGPLVLHFRRPSEAPERAPWQYRRLNGLLDGATLRALEGDGWTFVGSWMAYFHYFKRPAL